MHKRDFYKATTSVALNYVTKIAEMVSKLEVLGRLSVQSTVQDQYRLESIEASLKIDGIDDELSISNTKKAYASFSKSNLYSSNTLISTHSLLGGSSGGGYGVYRSTGSGVYVNGELVHVGDRPDRIPVLIDNLLNWVATTDVHPLIKSAVIHFELEFIHPFHSRNGVMGRLWQRQVLSEWSSIFTWLPLEVELHRRRGEYLETLYVSSRSADSSRFVEFMLEVIHATINELSEVRVARLINKGDRASLSKVELDFLQAIAGFTESHGSITNRDAQQLTGRSAESVKKHLARLVELDLLEAKGEKKGRKYVMASKSGPR